MLEHHDFGLSLKVANIQHSALSGMKMISNPPFSLFKHKLIKYTLNLFWAPIVSGEEVPSVNPFIQVAQVGVGGAKSFFEDKACRQV